MVFTLDGAFLGLEGGAGLVGFPFGLSGGDPLTKVEFFFHIGDTLFGSGHEHEFEHFQILGRHRGSETQNTVQLILAECAAFLREGDDFRSGRGHFFLFKSVHYSIMSPNSQAAMKSTWSQVESTPVFAPESERPLGFLRGIFFHPESGVALALQVGFFSVCAPTDIERWTPSGIHLNADEALSSPQDILRLKQFGIKRCALLGKKVRSKSGIRMGRLRDFTLETGSVSLLTFSVSKRFLFWEWNRAIFSFKDILEITENEVILTVDPRQSVPAKKEVKLARERAPRLSPASSTETN